MLLDALHTRAGILQCAAGLAQGILLAAVGADVAQLSVQTAQCLTVAVKAVHQPSVSGAHLFERAADIVKTTQVDT